MENPFADMTEEEFKEWLLNKLFRFVGFAILVVIGYFISSVFDINPALVGICFGSLLYVDSSKEKSEDEKKIDGKISKTKLE